MFGFVSFVLSATVRDRLLVATVSRVAGAFEVVPALGRPFDLGATSDLGAAASVGSGLFLGLPTRFFGASSCCAISSLMTFFWLFDSSAVAADEVFFPRTVVPVFGLVTVRLVGRPLGFAGLLVKKPSSSSESASRVGVEVRVAGVVLRGAFFFASAAAVDLVEVRPARFAGDWGITAARAMLIFLRVVFCRLSVRLSQFR